jgi:hypothetical protein
MVALADPMTAPRVIRRWRLELADRSIAGSIQPYHSAVRMVFDDAEKYLQRCSRATADMAQKAIRDAVSELRDYQVKGASVLLASGRPLPGLAGILASHALIHTAEGEFYRAALRDACASCGVPETGIKERELVAEASLALGRSAEDLQSTVAAFGKTVGSPWRQDEKLSALAAWLVLARHTRI